MDIKVNELSLSLPEGFRALSEEEKRQMNMIKEGEGEILKDEQRRILLSIAYKKVGFLSSLAEPSDAVRSMEKQVSDPMRDFGYELEGFCKEEVGGREAEAFSYSYTAQDIPMTGESMILKYGKTFYYLHAYYRTEKKEESRKVLEDIFLKASWNENKPF